MVPRCEGLHITVRNPDDREAEVETHWRVRPEGRRLARRRQGRQNGPTVWRPDLPVAEEAAITIELLGRRVERVYDVGVAGVHRLLDRRELLWKASAVVAVAGMEGALATVVGGIVDCPTIAVPTSVGYGVSFHGLTALLAMLNSCAPGVSVVNIDNGFGAGVCAYMITRSRS